MQDIGFDVSAGGPEKAWLRGHRQVPVDETTKHVVAIGVLEQWESGGDHTGRHLEIDASMRALAVVIADELPMSSLKMAIVEDEGPIQAFSPDRLHPTLRVGIGPG